MTSVIAWTLCVLRELRPDAVEKGRRGDHLGVATGWKSLLLYGRGIDSDAEPFRQDQGISRPGAGIAPDVLRPACADHGKAVDRLRRIDRMAAGDRDSGRGANGAAALQDLAHHLCRHLVERHAKDRQRHDRPAAHRIDVGDRVRCRDPAEIIGVIHHGHEEIGGGDDARRVVDLPYGGVIAGLGADKKLPEGIGLDLVREKLLQDGRRQLAAAAAAMGEAGQAYDRRFGDVGRKGGCHVNPPWIGAGQGASGPPNLTAAARWRSSNTIERNWQACAAMARTVQRRKMPDEKRDTYPAPQRLTWPLSTVVRKAPRHAGAVPASHRIVGSPFDKRQSCCATRNGQLAVTRRADESDRRALKRRSSCGTIGRPAAFQASKPPVTSVTFVMPMYCKFAAARLD